MNNLIVFSLIVLIFVDCDAKSVSLHEKEIDCLSQSKVYDQISDSCYKLLTRGPCDVGYWFVLEKPSSRSTRNSDLKITGICGEEKCPEGYYWAATNTCVQPKDKKQLCSHPSEEEILNNFFGEAECQCSRDPVRARLNGDENSRCYQLYTQGPCRRGEVVGFANDSRVKAECIQDRCYAEAVRRREAGKLAKDAVLAPWTNGTCYELGTQGPCPDTVKFKVDDFTLQPDCETLINAIFDLEKPKKCYQDENGDCQKVINPSKTQKAEKYKQELYSAIRKRRHLD